MFIKNHHISAKIRIFFKQITALYILSYSKKYHQKQIVILSIFVYS